MHQTEQWPVKVAGDSFSPSNGCFHGCVVILGCAGSGSLPCIENDYASVVTNPIHHLPDFRIEDGIVVQTNYLVGYHESTVH